MKRLIADIERNGERSEGARPPIAAEVTPKMLPKIEEAVR